MSTHNMHFCLEIRKIFIWIFFLFELRLFVDENLSCGYCEAVLFLEYMYIISMFSPGEI